MLAENYAEVSQVLQDAFEDAILMGVDESAMRKIFADIVAGLESPNLTKLVDIFRSNRGQAGMTLTGIITMIREPAIGRRAEQILRTEALGGRHRGESDPHSETQK